MNIKILYASKCGRVEKVAQSIADKFQLECIDVQENNEKLEPCDKVIIVAGGKYSGEDNAGMEAYIKAQKDGFAKYAFLITLDSNGRDNLKFLDWQKLNVGQGLTKQILSQKGVEILGEKICLTQYTFFFIGHPNRRDIEDVLEAVDKVIHI